jgi:cellulose synthase/poly-beta-1,6-N-acetylglucosamine synthase-like glycosyltransferase
LALEGVSALITAHNEEQNIATLIRRVAAERLPAPIDDVIVVASGCTDATVQRANECAAGLPVVRVIEQAKREGKASAINVGLAAARHDTIVLLSADVLPREGTLSRLLAHLEDPAVGAAGGRPVPLNDPRTFVGFAAHLMWTLHDAVSRDAAEPKCGEVIAFRKRSAGREIVAAIPRDTAVDEVAIQALITGAGLRTKYDPEALIMNWGPATLRDWFKQRRRINTGHVLSAREGYQPQTMSVRLVARAMLREPLCRRSPHRAAAVAAIEVAARLAAYADIARRRPHTVWDVARSTKRAIEPEAD